MEDGAARDLGSKLRLFGIAVPSRNQLVIGKLVPARKPVKWPRMLGPNGRLYKKKRTYWKHFSLIAILCIAAAAMIGLR